MQDAFNLFVGNRYPVIKDFLELDVVKNEFPKAAELVDNYGKTQVAVSGSNQGNEEDTVQVSTGVNNSAALTRMNKSFDGSSGSSSAVGQ